MCFFSPPPAKIFARRGTGDATRRAVASTERTRDGVRRDAGARDRMREKMRRSFPPRVARETRRDARRETRPRRAVCTDLVYTMARRRAKSRHATSSTRVASPRSRRERVTKVFPIRFLPVSPRRRSRDGFHGVDDRTIRATMRERHCMRLFDSLALLADTACDMNRRTSRALYPKSLCAPASSYFLPSIAYLAFFFERKENVFSILMYLMYLK